GACPRWWWRTGSCPGSRECARRSGSSLVLAKVHGNASLCRLIDEAANQLGRLDGTVSGVCDLGSGSHFVSSGQQIVDDGGCPLIAEARQGVCPTLIFGVLCSRDLVVQRCRGIRYEQ